MKTVMNIKNTELNINITYDLNVKKLANLS